MEKFCYDEDSAIEEVISNTAPTVLMDEQFVRGLYNNDRTLFDKIREFFEELKQVFAELTQRGSWVQDTALDEESVAKIAEVFDKVAMETANIADEGDIKLSLKDIDNYTRVEYNHHGWAKVHDVLSDKELATFMSRLSDQRNGARFDRTADGMRMYDVGTKHGVNNVIIVSDGKYKNPSIERVYRIALDADTLAEIERTYIHDTERENGAEAYHVIKEIYGQELVYAYAADDFPTYSEVLAERSQRQGSRSGKAAGDRELQRNGGNDRGAGEESGLKFSAKDPVERKGTLLAIHNLTGEKLRKFLALGGAPMPFIAVTRSDVEHSNFGDISLIFDKSKLSLFN